MPKEEEITRLVAHYVADTERRYAVAIVGAWGSGKTRYVETALRKSLEAQGKRLVRVSMFGLSSADELFERMIEAFARLSSGRQGSPSAGVEAIGEGVKGMLSRLLEKAGVSYQASAKLVASLLCGADTVIAFDDVERVSASLDESELFGTINNLVENEASKVLLIANEPDAIDPEIREKLVWKIVAFEPDIEEAVTSVFNRVFSSSDADCVREIIISAARDAGCGNVRALIKAAPLVEMALASPVVNSAAYARENVESALGEFFSFSFEAAMGHPPTKSLVGVDESDAERVRRIYDDLRYERFSDLDVISRFFDSGSLVEQADVDASLEEYMRKRYPESAGEYEMKRALEEMRAFTEQDDEAVAPKLARLAASLKKADFDPYDLVEALQVNDYLLQLGFSEALSAEEAKSCGRKVVDADPGRAYERFHGRYAMWNDMLWHDCAALRELDRYCLEQHARSAREQLGSSLDFDDPACGIALVERLEAMRASDALALLEVPPADVATCFQHGNAASQVAVYEFLKSLAFASGIVPGQRDAFCRWLSSVKGALSSVEPAGKLGTVRLRWALEAIDEILAHARWQPADKGD